MCQIVESRCMRRTTTRTLAVFCLCKFIQVEQQFAKLYKWRRKERDGERGGRKEETAKSITSDKMDSRINGQSISKPPLSQSTSPTKHNHCTFSEMFCQNCDLKKLPNYLPLTVKQIAIVCNLNWVISI